MSSNNLDKYELLTVEYLGLKQSTIEQATFEYSPLGKTFNKGLSEDDKKEGVSRRLKNIKDTNKVTKLKNKDIIEVTDFVNQPLSFKAKELMKLKPYRKMLITEN